MNSIKTVTIVQHVLITLAAFAVIVAVELVAVPGIAPALAIGAATAGLPLILMLQLLMHTEHAEKRINK